MGKKKDAQESPKEKEKESVKQKRRSGKRRIIHQHPQVMILIQASPRRKSTKMKGRKMITLTTSFPLKIFLMKSVRKIPKQTLLMTCLLRTFLLQHLTKENQPQYHRTRRTPISWTTGTMRRDTIGSGLGRF